jgi:ATP-dependent DNA ligase
MAEDDPKQKMRAFFGEVAIAVAPFYLARMLRVRSLPSGFIAPCLPTKADTLPSGGLWIHEIKHDGFRIIARKDGERVTLYSRPGNDFTRRFPPIARALTHLRCRSCIIDGEAVICDDNGVTSFEGLGTTRELGEARHARKKHDEAGRKAGCRKSACPVLRLKATRLT